MSLKSSVLLQSVTEVHTVDQGWILALPILGQLQCER